MRWRVAVLEYERGWGSRIDFIEYFPENEHEKARKFVETFNAENTSPTIPNWYRKAANPVLVE